MSIRSKLRDTALDTINDMIEKLEAKAIEICGDTPVDPKELCRLASTGNQKTLVSKLQSRIADRMEQQIIADLTPQEEREEETFGEGNF